jgi:hypothetical protein
MKTNCISLTFLTLLAFSATMGLWPTQAQAGCKLNLAIQNTGKNKLKVNSAASKVKKKAGTWRRLYRGDWNVGYVNPGKTVTDVYKAGFGCATSRKFQIHYGCADGPKKGQSFVKYYPRVKRGGSAQWTKRQSVTIPLNKCQ